MPNKSQFTGQLHEKNWTQPAPSGSVLHIQIGQADPQNHRLIIPGAPNDDYTVKVYGNAPGNKAKNLVAGKTIAQLRKGVVIPMRPNDLNHFGVHLTYKTVTGARDVRVIVKVFTANSSGAPQHGQAGVFDMRSAWHHSIGLLIGVLQ